ncbi:hypothetical protein TRIP_E100024 [uncultured Spirochaetota bacterium]|nr:hypothetical protein TRIP_E100024 [uncultured Spirochaetota bacterium]
MQENSDKEGNNRLLLILVVSKPILRLGDNPIPGGSACADGTIVSVLSSPGAAQKGSITSGYGKLCWRWASRSTLL